MAMQTAAPVILLDRPGASIEFTEGGYSALRELRGGTIRMFIHDEVLKTNGAPNSVRVR